MKLLITGGTGFVGQHLVSELKRRNLPYQIAVRTQAGNSAYPECISVGDINAHTAWSQALEGVTDVVHLAARVHITQETSTDAYAAFRAVNTEGTLNLARQAAAAGVRRFVFLSSVKVNGEGSPHAYRETDTPAPEDAYAVSKWEAEKGLWEISAETGMQIVILRIPLVYGPGVGANFLQLLQTVNKGWPLPLGGIHNRRSLLYVGNLVDAIVVALQHADAANKLYLLSDGQDVSTSQLVELIAKALNKPPRLFAAPQGL
ncbi:MAG: NAD-dependent epimerase/dehydratase family protein, partial [Betaproteobacteria bacterium]|nr:NAD-dependent epimerase/dehydratase family protein [Betaproteobacteria bacterium]